MPSRILCDDPLSGRELGFEPLTDLDPGPRHVARESGADIPSVGSEPNGAFRSRREGDRGSELTPDH